MDRSLAENEPAPVPPDRGRPRAWVTPLPRTPQAFGEDRRVGHDHGSVSPRPWGRSFRTMGRSILGEGSPPHARDEPIPGKGPGPSCASPRGCTRLPDRSASRAGVHRCVGSVHVAGEPHPSPGGPRSTATLGRGHAARGPVHGDQGFALLARRTWVISRLGSIIEEKAPFRARGGSSSLRSGTQRSPATASSLPSKTGSHSTQRPTVRRGGCRAVHDEASSHRPVRIRPSVAIGRPCRPRPWRLRTKGPGVEPKRPARTREGPGRIRAWPRSSPATNAPSGKGC